MRLQNRFVAAAAFLLAICTLLALPRVVSAADDEAPKVSAFAPAKDLASQADWYIKDLGKIVASEDEYKDGAEKVAKEANTLVIIALCLGLNDQDSKYKESAGALLKAAQELAATKDFAAAQKGVANVKTAAETKSDVKLQWEKVASLPELMKQVPVINSKLKLNIKASKFASKAKDTAGYTAVIAAIAQGSMADTSATKGADQVKQWKEFSAALRDNAGAVNAAIHKGDQEAADKAMQKLAQSCDDCHDVFHKEDK
jgi:ribosomal protein S20